MSTQAMSTGQVLYFGKVPSRGDFVRSTGGSALIQHIDQWLSQTMALMAQDPRWKIAYDAAEPVHFAILGPQSHVGLVGHLSASRDASGRRFPFVAAVSFDVPEPFNFIPHSPQALAPLWQRLNTVVGTALHDEDFANVQVMVGTEPLDVGFDADSTADAYAAFTRTTTIERLEATLPFPALTAADEPFSFRQTALALGLLLQPVISQGASGMNKGLALPLPRDAALLPQVLTLWVDLVSRFFRRTNAELALLVTVQRKQPLLVLGFQGASPATLRSALDAQACQDVNVDVAQARWVEEWVGSDYGLRKLSNHLRDPSLSLAAAIDMFRETFFGD
jgi:type VI secretion system protein ImpM